MVVIEKTDRKERYRQTGRQRQEVKIRGKEGVGAGTGAEGGWVAAGKRSRDEKEKEPDRERAVLENETDRLTDRQVADGWITGGRAGE